MLVAQFIPLYHVHVPTSSAPIKTVGTGANHGWAPVPIALVCFALAAAVYRHGNRTALLGLAVLGVATLLIALLGDLPDAHATGLIGSSANQYVQGVSSPSAGLYLETLGAVLLLVSGGVGFLMLGSAPAGWSRRHWGTASDRGGDGEPPAPPESQEAGPRPPARLRVLLASGTVDGEVVGILTRGVIELQPERNTPLPFENARVVSLQPPVPCGGQPSRLVPVASLWGPGA